MELRVHTVEEWSGVAERLLEWCGAGRQKIAFYGEIGAGKTTFIKAICVLLGVEDYVSSPTFALVNEYVAGQERVFHLDLYRLHNIQEALDIGIEDYLYSPFWCFIEWPELIEPLLPEETVRVKIEALEDSSRKVLFL